MKSLQIFFVLLAVVATLVIFSPVRANPAVALTVTDCSNDNQLRAHVQTLQVSGGSITFNCGIATITLTSQLPEIITNTVIDGGGKITLSGNNTVSLFYARLNSSLTLKSIILEKGLRSNSFGGAILNEGYLLLDKATVRNSHSDYDGGAIASFNQLEIIDSVLANNSADNGGAIYATDLTNDARLVIRNTKLYDNTAGNTMVGGAIASGVPFEITNSEFDRNKAGSGGALFAHSANGPSMIGNSVFRANETTGTHPNANGGALLVDATTLNVQTTRFLQNKGQRGAAINVKTDGTLIMTESTLSSNDAYYSGGGIVNTGSTTLTNVTLAGNLSGYAAGIQNYGTLTLTNVTLSGNNGQYSGALENHGGFASLTNVTFWGNSGPETTAAGIMNAGTNPQLYLKNVIIGNSLTGPNCRFLVERTGAESNFSSDNSCYFLQSGRDNVDLKLGALANNGGLTQTHLPQAVSPVVDGGTNSVCPTTDQRGVSRPQGTKCDAGAVEVTPTPPTPTPTSTRTATPTKTPTKTATPTGQSCTSKPTAPVLIQPANGAQVSKARVALDWNDVPCATKYKVIVKQDNKKGLRVFRKKVTDSKVKTTALAPGHRYHWRVKACNTFGCKPSNWFKFTKP